MAGPFAAQRLGDLGADVVKVEPVTGEWQRHAAAGGARGKEVNVSFLSLNRNKRSLAVDLKAPAGKDILLRLIKTADVFLQNYRPGVAKRLGVDYEALSKVNPRLIYVSMSGYGEDGPYRDWPGQDLVLQGLSGAMLSAGREGEAPMAAGQYLVDAVTAYTFIASARGKDSSCRSTCSTRLRPCRCRSCRCSRSAGSRRSDRPSRTRMSISAHPMVRSPRATASSSWRFQNSRNWAR
jgi:hypothetical protein